MKPIPGLQIEDQSEDVVGPMTLVAEARGEGPVGMLAVWKVIKRRAQNRGWTPKQVMLFHKGPVYWFSCFSPADPNRAKMLEFWRTDARAWGWAESIVDLDRAVVLPDPTHGATHYYNPEVAQPKWGRGHPDWKETAVIGRHVFGIAP